MRHLPLTLAAAALLRTTTAQQPLNESDILGTLDDLINSLDGSVGNSTIDDVYSYVSDQAQAGLQAILKYIFPEQYWSYGRSPPVYPTPVGGNDPAWQEAYAQASALVAELDNIHVASLTLGSSDTRGCSGFIDPVAGFPGMCLQDNENGVRGTDQSSGFPSQLSIGASWNRSLALERAQFLGREFKASGANVVLGPVGGPIGRIARGGRNWEGFSNDPYLSGQLIAPTVTGIQESVIACVKHWLFNEQETNRNPFAFGFLGYFGNQAVSSNVDDRTTHELYMWPFQDALAAGAGSVMCSYQRANNSYGCQNSKLMNGLLKGELGFQGFVVSDWYAVHTGIAANEAGLDMVMPSSSFLTPESLAEAVNNGSVSAERLTDQATRILAAWYRFAELEEPGLNQHEETNAQAEDVESTLLQGAIEGHVLVKNTEGALPLDPSSTHTLNLFGYDAIGGLNTSAEGFLLYDMGLANTQKYEDGRIFTFIDYYLQAGDILPDPHAGPQIALDGTILSGGGSGAVKVAWSISAHDALASRARTWNQTLHTQFVDQKPTVKAPDAPCIVMINAQSSEGWDRSGIRDEYSDTLVQNVASQCKNTIVVIHNAGVRLVDSWIENPNVTAVIFAHVPGQMNGEALAAILYGEQSPSGRLPYTVAKTEADYGDLLSPSLPSADTPLYPQSTFDEGLFIDYKHFIQQDITPRFPFGYGLTYTNFTYSNLSIRLAEGATTSPLPPAFQPSNPNTTTTLPQGGNPSLFDHLATISVQITNSGSVTAAEVAQLYIEVASSDLPLALRGFEKKLLSPGETETFSFPLRRKDLSVWDVGQQEWVLSKGPHGVRVGKSVGEILVEGTLELN
ncbi:putative beta-glucosidase [Hortaea werneckii]|uniref:beta-glucosidase n=1 Tax=Hortaea werneckii TaxID=91943 RepID=A0A3M7I1A7_HORWE|nr:putative beta-glucosidase [Hortaea werneckii]KAI6791978.1 putative beta-glucosidase [Hortaea werneckii]KAI6897964.1 putative beta-glucosidase [Hortaea werneckii]KAI6918853.1 putative beta-glucosidase [Hortaea werneckii]KAI6951608.1 putative beta-glucosidase [Hortaea werneckii]